MKRNFSAQSPNRRWLGHGILITACVGSLLTASGCQKKPLPASAQVSSTGNLSTSHSEAGVDRPAVPGSLSNPLSQLANNFADTSTSNREQNAPSILGGLFSHGGIFGQSKPAKSAAANSVAVPALGLAAGPGEATVGAGRGIASMAATSTAAALPGANSASLAPLDVGTHREPLNPAASAHSSPAGNPAPAVALAPVPGASCQTLSFRHKAGSGHSTTEACSHHRNQLVLPGTHPYTAKNMCVRVDGKAVKFAASQPGSIMTLLLGPVAGPESKITVRYSEQNERCNLDCVITEAEAPHDSFMEAIGGNAPVKGDDGKAKVAAWNNTDGDADVTTELDADLKAELADENSELVVFNGWAADAELAHK